LTLKALQAFKLKLKATGKHSQESLLTSAIKKCMSIIPLNQLGSEISTQNSKQNEEKSR